MAHVAPFRRRMGRVSVQHLPHRYRSRALIRRHRPLGIWFTGSVVKNPVLTPQGSAPYAGPAKDRWLLGFPESKVPLTASCRVDGPRR